MYLFYYFECYLGLHLQFRCCVFDNKSPYYKLFMVIYIYLHVHACMLFTLQSIIQIENSTHDTFLDFHSVLLHR